MTIALETRSRFTICFRVSVLTWERLRLIAESGASVGDGADSIHAQWLREIARQFDYPDGRSSCCRFRAVGNGDLIECLLGWDAVRAVCGQVGQTYAWRSSVARKQIVNLIRAIVASSPESLVNELLSMPHIKTLVVNTRL